MVDSSPFKPSLEFEVDKWCCLFLVFWVLKLGSYENMNGYDIIG